MQEHGFDGRRITFSAGAVTHAGDWALISGGVSDHGRPLTPDGISLVAHRQAGQWIAVGSSTPTAERWLCQAPRALLPAAAARELRRASCR
jgi:hypothetical protein